MDLAESPFQIIVIDELADGHAAVLAKVHHALTDAVRFQTILGLLSDDEPSPPKRRRGTARRESPPPAAVWLAQSAWRLAPSRPQCRQATARRAEAVATLKAWQAAHPRPKTPTLKLSGPTSALRDYAMPSFYFETTRAAARIRVARSKTCFLQSAQGRCVIICGRSGIACFAAGCQFRAQLSAARARTVWQSYCRHDPALATHIDDPIERLHAIQASMAAEKQRTHLDEALLDQPEIFVRPARPAEALCATRARRGPAARQRHALQRAWPRHAPLRSMSGFRQVANFPIPLLWSGRFLNITSWRNGDYLDLGIMADPSRITDLGRLVILLSRSVEAYVALSADPTP